MSEDGLHAAAGATPLFILSFRQRDELAALAGSAGWQVVAARRAGGVERRFLASGAAVAVVDARGALADGLDGARQLGPAIEANGGAMLVLVSRGDQDAIAELYEAGATHFLSSPSSEAEFLQALRYAARHATRMAGDWRASAGVEPLGWRLDLAERTILLTPAFARLLGVDEQPGRAQILRRIDPRERPAALAALRRITAEKPATAFAHDLSGIGRVVQHLHLDAAGARVDAIVEPLGSAPEPSAELREALAGARDAGSARRWIGRRLAEDNPTPLSAMLVALNRFDMINTAYGRTVGDGLLRGALKRIEEAAREVLGREALVSRMSGSSYLVAARSPRERIDLAAERIAGELARPFVTGETIAVLGCRIGLAEAVTEDDSGTLLRRASEALADARASDSTLRIAEAGAADETPIDTLAVALHHAIEQGEIDILFQPQVSVSTGAIVGVEALARWEHAKLGTIGAETLFAAAARAELEIGLSDHIQKITLERAAAWPAELRGLRLALNLTAADIARPGFADRFLDRVDTSGFPRSRLTLEITESGLIEDLGIAASLLSELRTAGCRIAIDDFGTGYSSLAYLKALPLDYLKIDKKLAQDITGTPRDRVVVRGVIDMARSLGLTVIAEGVETEEQLELLAKEGCQLYQGFLRSEAVSSAMLAGLVAG